MFQAAPTGKTSAIGLRLVAIALTAGLLAPVFVLSSCGEPSREGARAAGATRAAPGRQVALELPAANGGPLHYLLYLPRTYQRGKRMPLLLYLHGADRLGTGRRALSRVRRQGIPKAVDGRTAFPFIAVSPQTHTRWDPAQLVKLLDVIQRRYAVDASRVYATGFSLGGYGVWDLAMAYPRRFAAVAPLADGPGSRRARCRPRPPARWAFHGTAARVVPASESKAMVRTVRRCGAYARLTLYPRAGHFVAERTYGKRSLYRWLAATERSRP